MMGLWRPALKAEAAAWGAQGKSAPCRRLLSSWDPITAHTGLDGPGELIKEAWNHSSARGDMRRKRPKMPQPGGGGALSS